MEEPAKKKKRCPLSVEARKRKQESDRVRSQARVHLGRAFPEWRELKENEGCKTDADLALLLIRFFKKHAKGPDIAIHMSVTRKAQPPPPSRSSNGVEPQRNLWISAENRPEPLKFERRDSIETCDSMDGESAWSSSNADQQETCAASSANRKVPGGKVAGSQDRRLTTSLSQHQVKRDIEEDEDEEISTTLSVGDGRYLVDLGSSSEFIVDEECILQMFKSCRECSKQCAVRKRVQGLKIVITQKCHFCDSNFTWTNLPDADEDDDGDLQINGQTNTATSPSSNTS